MKKINIVLVIHSMHLGGSERITLYLLKNLDRQKFAITFVLLNREGALVQYVPDDVNVISYNFKRTFASGFQLLKILRHLNPDIVFSTLSQVNLLISLLIPFLSRKTLFVARESSIVSENNKNDRYPAIFRFLYNTTFNNFHSIICQSVSMKDDLLMNFRVDVRKITVINNPVDLTLFPTISSARKRNRERINLISVGRLRKEKGHERLLYGLAKCNIPFYYRIIGDGPLKDAILRLVTELGLTGKVEVMGEIPMPYDLVSEADLFLQGSYFEGFPNALIEANACGVPVAALKAPGGHNEIIIEGLNGWIIESPEDLPQLIASGVFLNVDRLAIYKSVKERYSHEQIIAEFEQLFLDLISRHNHL